MISFERQFAGDPRFHVQYFPRESPQNEELHYTSLVSAQNAQSFTIDGYPEMRVVPVGALSAATRMVDCCSAVILHGQKGSSHWVFGHIESGWGFPDVQVLRDTRAGIAEQATLFVLGASPTDRDGVFDDDIKARRLQVNRVLQQVNDCHISLARENIHLFYNNIYGTFINVVARVGENGLESAHIMHVRL